MEEGKVVVHLYDNDRDAQLIYTKKFLHVMTLYIYRRNNGFRCTTTLQMDEGKVVVHLYDNDRDAQLIYTKFLHVMTLYIYRSNNGFR